MREFYTKNLVSKFWMSISRCSINKSDIIEVRVYMETYQIVVDLIRH